MKNFEKFIKEEVDLRGNKGVPDDFKYLAVAESGLENNSSSAGAAGFWHFLKSSAKEYGLEVNQNVDERYNLEKATKVAADYLKKSYPLMNMLCFP